MTAKTIFLHFVQEERSFMNKQKKLLGRVIAFMLSLVMVCSSFGASSISAYAAGSTGDTVVVEADDTTEAESTQEDVSDNELVTTETSSEENSSEVVPSTEETSEESAITEDTVLEDTVLEDTVEEDVIAEEEGEPENNYAGVSGNDWCGPSLDINAWEMEEAGMTVSDNAIISILEAQEAKFSVVSLNMNSESTASTDSISAEVWNAIVGVLDPSVSTEEGYTEIRFNVGGDTSADENWNFIRPTEATADVTIGMIWVPIDSEGHGMYVSFANTEFPADEANVNIYTDDLKDDYESILRAMGDNPMVTVYDEDENKVENVSGRIESGTFEERDTFNVSFGSVKDLEANTNYIVTGSVYIGRIDYWTEEREDDSLYEMARLCLNPGDAGKEYLTVEDILTALINNEDGSVDEIIIEYPTQDFDYIMIDDDIVNGSLRLFKDNDEEKRLIFAERSENAKACIEYKLVNPYEDENVESYNAVSANMILTEDAATVSVHIPELSAERVDVHISYYPESEGNTKAGNLFGNSRKDLELAEKPDVYCWYDCNEWGSVIGIDGADTLATDIGYTLQNKTFRGFVEGWEGYEVLRIAFYDAGKEEALTKDEIKAVLALNAGVSFNEVLIEQPYDGENPANNVIDAEVINEAMECLKEPREYDDVAISFAFSDASGNRIWRYINPKGTAAAGSVSANAVLDVHTHEGQETACFEKYGSVSFNGLNTKRIDLEFTVSHAIEGEEGEPIPLPLAEALIDMFGDSLARLTTDDTKVEIDYRVEEHGIVVNVLDSEKLENNQEYALEKDEYRGIVEDGVLFIYPWHVEPYGLEYSEELILDVLQFHADAENQFARIEIGFVEPDSDPNTEVISAAIYNAAAPLIDTDADAPLDNLGKGVKFVFYEADCAAVWGFVAPTSIDDDIEMNHWIGLDENGNVIMAVNKDDFSDTRMTLEVVPNANEDGSIEEDTLLYDLIERLGDGTEEITYAVYPIVEREPIIFGWNQYGDEIDPRMQIFINGVDALSDDTVYEVISMTPGSVWFGPSFEDGVPGEKNLHVSADNLGIDTFKKGDIAKYLSYYAKMLEYEDDTPFDHVYIEMPRTWDDAKGVPNNVIYKDDYNFIRENLLNTGNENASIIFTFDESEVYGGESEEDDVWLMQQGRYEYIKSRLMQQVRYEFVNPSAMTKDITASFDTTFQSFYQHKDEFIKCGVDITQTGNTYPASGVNIQIHADVDSAYGMSMEDSLGIPGEDEGILCCILKDKDTLSDTVNDTWLKRYSDEDTGRSIYMLHIGLAQNVPAKTTCTIYPVQERGEDRLYVGLKEKLNPCVSENDVIWKSLTPQTAKIVKDAEGNYYIEPIMEGTAFYGYYCEVENGKIPIVEIFNGTVEKKALSMKFANASKEQPLEVVAAPKDATWVKEAYLDLRFFPTETGVDAADLNWFVGTVSDPTVSANCIALVTDEEGNETGEFVAVEKGEAIVTVTSESDPTLKATAKVIVKHAVEDELEGVELEIHAIEGYDKTLADIEHLLPENMKWVNNKVSLSDYANSDLKYDEFSAIYTSPVDGRTLLVPIGVYIESFESIKLSADMNGDVLNDGDIVEAGNTVNIGLYVDTESDPLDIIELINTIGPKREDVTFEVSAVSNPKNILTPDTVNENIFVFNPSADEKGKKTFTLSLDVVNKETKRVTSVATRSMNIYVPGKPVFDWDEFITDNYLADNAYFFRDCGDGAGPWGAVAVVGEKGEFTLIQPKNDYYKITAKSLDTKVCKIKSVKVTDVGEYKHSTFEYEVLSGGRAFIQLTAADEVKSSFRVEFVVQDIMPKAETSTGTIDTTRTEMSTSVNWQLKYDTELDDEELALSGKDSEKFEAEVAVGGTRADVTISVKDDFRDIKPGKYKLDVSVPVTLDDLTETFTTTVTVTVVAPKNPVKVSQLIKPNVFYKANGSNEDALGVLALSVTSTEVTMTNQEGKLCDYELMVVNGNAVGFALKDDGNPKNNNANLTITVDGLYEPVNVPIKLKYENKKPSYVLDTKSVTLYPDYSNAEFNAYIMDKQQYYGIISLTYPGDDIQVQDASGNWISLAIDEEEEVTLKNNTYMLSLSSDGSSICGYTLSNKKATDTLKIRVKRGTWSDETFYLPLSLKIKVDPSVPKLVAGNKTLTLNKNDAFYASEVATTHLYLKDGAKLEEYTERTFDVIGLDDKSINALNSNLNISILDSCGDIELEASFNGKDQLDKTSYKYRVILHQEGCADISTDITIKVVDTPPAKAISVSAKGSIDVLDIENSGVMYTAKLKDVNGYGSCYDSYLIGPDADKFYIAGVVGETSIVKADSSYPWSTKQTYYVTPVFVFTNKHGDYFEIQGKQQKIKVKEGKAKVTVSSPNGNVLYRERDNELIFKVEPNYKNNPDLEIRRIELVNYTGDLELYSIGNDEYLLRQSSLNQIIASGKTWNLKFNVYFEGKAVNTKPLQFTYKISVK